MIEVELRAFIPDERYAELRARFDAEGELLSEDSQETIYYAGEQDFRLQGGNEKAKLILKSGKVHDESREELEVHFSPEQFLSAKKLLERAGHETEIIWYRHRRLYAWKGIEAALDDTRGYGKILELEKIAKTEGETESAREELARAFEELGLSPTSRQEFDAAFQNYKAHWRSLTKEL